MFETLTNNGRHHRRGVTVVCMENRKYYNSIQEAVKDACSKYEHISKFTMAANLSTKGKYTSKLGIRFCTKAVYDEYMNKVRLRHAEYRQKCMPVPSDVQLELDMDNLNKKVETPKEAIVLNTVENTEKVEEVKPVSEIARENCDKEE